MSGLEDLLKHRIALTGPISVADYMGECLGHPVHGYYQTRDPLGQAGDFTTAPEISQMFGELLGAWAAVLWQGMGCPEQVMLVELGPGRGTLMSDALRATRALPGFHQAVKVVLVETSPVLRAKQEQALSGYDVDISWSYSVSDLPEQPMILLANEFFDALPIRQFEVGEDGKWRERLIAVGTESEELGWTLSRPVPLPTAVVPSEPVAGSVFEVNPAGIAIAAEIGRRLKANGGAALIIDYGHDGQSFGDTLQAVQGHRYHPVLEMPGQADLTAHVDFRALALAAREAGARPEKLMSQGALLNELGLGARAEMLAQSAKTEAQQKAVGEAMQRLAAPEGMGRLFKALCLTAPNLAVPPGFEAGEES